MDTGDVENLEDEDPAFIENDRSKKFTVSNPVKNGSHYTYMVTGEDDEGEFNESRRFREFHALATVLRTRWPGCYVPAIPEKKLVNSNSD